MDSKEFDVYISNNSNIFSVNEGEKFTKSVKLLKKDEEVHWVDIDLRKNLIFFNKSGDLKYARRGTTQGEFKTKFLGKVASMEKVPHFELAKLYKERYLFFISGWNIISYANLEVSPKVRRTYEIPLKRYMDFLKLAMVSSIN